MGVSSLRPRPVMGQQEPIRFLVNVAVRPDDREGLPATAPLQDLHSKIANYQLSPDHTRLLRLSTANAANVTNLIGKEARDLEDSGPRERHEHPEVWSEKIKYLEPEFTALFLNGLRGLAPDAVLDSGYRGRELARNAAIGELALSTGLRLQEFSYLLVYELPALPPRRLSAPIPFPVPQGVTKGRKFRTTWISYDALAVVHHYVDLDRAVTADGSGWRPPERWGEALLVTEADARGGRVNGVRRRWDTLIPHERRRLVAPDGGSCLLAVRNGGGPFTAWSSVFERTANRIRSRFEPRFPHVHPHRLRHSMAMQTLEYLVTGHYRQAAKLVTDTDADAALVFYLSKADPMLVLRDLLGHSSVLVTEKYLRRLDTTRIYRDAYDHAGITDGLLEEADTAREADAEFDENTDGGVC
jgi:integrase